MKSNDELKEINIKTCTCFYFDDINKIEDLNLSNVFAHEKSFENSLTYNIS